MPKDQESIKTFNEKFLAFQQEVGAIKKDKNNPFYQSKYADINSLLETVKPVLTTHGLTIMQPLDILGDRVILRTIVQDSTSKDSITSVVFLPDIQDPQKIGSAITYFRRYSLQALLALEAEDDDGNTASSYKARGEEEFKKAQAVQADEMPYPKKDVFRDEMGMEEPEHECKECGTAMIYKEGVTKVGKPYKGWFCPKDKKHKVEWVN